MTLCGSLPTPSPWEDADWRGTARRCIRLLVLLLLPLLLSEIANITVYEIGKVSGTG